MRYHKLLIALGMVVCAMALLLIGMGVMDLDDRLRGEVEMPSNARRSPRNLTKAGFEANAMWQKARQSGVLENEYSRMTLAELQELAKNGNSPRDTESLRQFFARWVELDPYSAVEHVEKREHNGTHEFRILFEKWAAIDPQNAARYIQAESDHLNEHFKEYRDFQVMPIVSAEWAKRDLKGALDWVLGLDANQDHALSPVMAVMAKQDPARAATMTDALDLPDLRKTKEAIAEVYGSQDFKATMEWVNSMAEDEKEEATRAAVRGLAKTNPEAAVEFSASIQNRYRKEEVITDIIGIIALDDPPRAVRLIEENLRKEHALQERIDALIRPWARSDSDAALDYAMNLTNQHLRDNALNTYIRSADSIQPSMKVRIAESVSSDSTRSTLIQTYMWGWMDEDRDAAMEYLEATHEIPDDIKKLISDKYPK